MNLEELNAQLIDCRRCPRLVEWREEVAATKRKAFADETYWGRPVPAFGDPSARLVIVGLAPAAHGANRTGRMFTGDRSGDWLFRALHRAGFASEPMSVGLGDGLQLRDCYITAAVRCAPPANKPTPQERETCSSWLIEELALLQPVVIVTLGSLAYGQTARLLGTTVPRPRPKFGHGVEYLTSDGLRVIASYHPSQQNTFTGKLTEPMLDDIFERCRRLLTA